MISGAFLTDCLRFQDACNPGNTYEVYMKQDSYQARHVGYNAWTDHGADDDSDPLTGQTAQMCQQACTADATCSCVVYRVGRGSIPLCVTSDSSDDIGNNIQYLGCFNDALDHDGANTGTSGLDTGQTMGDCEAGQSNIGSGPGTLGTCRDMDGACKFAICLVYAQYTLALD